MRARLCKVRSPNAGRWAQCWAPCGKNGFAQPSAACGEGQQYGVGSHMRPVLLNVCASSAHLCDVALTDSRPSRTLLRAAVKVRTRNNVQPSAVCGDDRLYNAKSHMRPALPKVCAFRARLCSVR